MPFAPAPALDADAAQLVVERLADVRRDHAVAIPLAVESGSRAWGFPSPDSDYDCRFVYVRPMRDYLDPWPPRDVIETPLDEVLDVNGWDLLKAVRLVVKGNATILEWVNSPLTYHVDEEFRAGLAGLAEEVADRALVAHHYAHIAAGQRERWASGREAALKKVFYAVRPAAVLRWMRAHPGSVASPVDLGRLLVEGDAPSDVVDAAAELVALKSVTRELGSGVVPEVLSRFVADEIALWEGATPVRDGRRPEEVRAVAGDYFRATLSRYAPR